MLFKKLIQLALFFVFCINTTYLNKNQTSIKPASLAAQTHLKSIALFPQEAKEMVSWELLKSLQIDPFSNLLIIQKAEKITLNHTTFITVSVKRKFPSDKFVSVPKGMQILTQELSPVDTETLLNRFYELNVNQFELLFNAQGILLAIFPNLDETPSDVRHQKEVWHYMDISPYNIKLSDLQNQRRLLVVVDLLAKLTHPDQIKSIANSKLAKTLQNRFLITHLREEPSFAQQLFNECDSLDNEKQKIKFKSQIQQLASLLRQVKLPFSSFSLEERSAILKNIWNQTWRPFAQQWEKDQQAIKQYKNIWLTKNQKANTQLKIVPIDSFEGRKEKKPFLFAAIYDLKCQAGNISLIAFNPNEYGRCLELQNDFCVHTPYNPLLLPVLPTVYPPGLMFGSDRTYHHNLFYGNQFKKGSNIDPAIFMTKKTEWVSFEGKFKLAPRSKALGYGPGSGLDLAFAYIRTQAPIHYQYLNPLEDINAQLTGIINDMLFYAKKEGLYDVIFWNMPYFAEKQNEEPTIQLEKFSDVGFGKQSMQDFIEDLKQSLHSEGFAVLWNNLLIYHPLNNAGFNLNLTGFTTLDPNSKPSSKMTVCVYFVKKNDELESSL